MLGVGAKAAIVTLILSASFARAEEPKVTVAPPAAAPPPLTSYGPFHLDAKLEPRVRFWVDVYAKYHSYESVISDVKFPQLVFGSVDTRGKPGAVASEKGRIASVLSRLLAVLPEIKAGKLKPENLKPSSREIYEVFQRENLLAALPEIAANPRRLRAQAGLRDTLEDSLFTSGRYLPRMEALFQRFRLPVEIAYLPFVESGFNKRAVSKVGASGIWQFMPYTGKLFLRVDEVVDERNDPMRAAEAAARLMKQNFDVLGDWALAITAYNHGTAGMAKATRDTGSREISEIIDRYESKSFGFASQNFYACFLAALHVTKNSDTYLGNIPRAKKLEFDEFVMPDFMALKDFIEKMNIDPTVFHELNPALTDEVYSGRKYIPVGYTVRVPVEASSGFLARYEAIPETLKFRVQKEDAKIEVAQQSGVVAPEAGRSPASETPAGEKLIR